MKFIKKTTFLILFILIAIPINNAYAENKKKLTINLNKITNEKRLRLIQYLILNKEYDKATFSIFFKPFIKKNNILSAYLFFGDILFLSNKKKQAIKFLKNILYKNPKNIIIRFKLAQILFYNFNIKDSKYHFKILQKYMINIKNNKHKQLVNFYLKKIANNKNWFFNIKGSYSPKNNFNNGVIKDIYYCKDFGSNDVEINKWRNIFINLFKKNCDVGIITPERQKAKNGFVLNTTITTGYNFKINQNYRWIAKITGQFIKYPHTLSNILVLTSSISSIINLNNQTRLTISTNASHIISKNKIAKRNLILSADIMHILNHEFITNNYLSIIKTNNYNDNDLNGIILKLENNIKYSFNTENYIQLNLGIKRGEFKHKNNNFSEINSKLIYNKKLIYDIFTTSAIEITFRHKNLENIKEYNFNTKFIKKNLNILGFLPQINISYYNYNSTINRFDKYGPSIGIGIIKTF